jgi:hypothetical protein
VGSLSRRNLLLASATAAAFGRAPRARAAAGAPKYFVVVFANGGWDPTYVLDPKLGRSATIQGPEADPGNPAPLDEEIRTFGDIPILTNDGARPAVTTFFERWSSRCHVLNGVWTGSIAHAPCRLRLFTGGTDPLAPDVPTVFGAETGTSEPLGTVDLSGLSYPGPLASSTGRIGFQSQIKALVDPDATWPKPDGATRPYPYYRADAAHRALIEEHLQSRAAVFRAARGDGGANDHLVDGFLESLDRAGRFRAEGASLLDDLILGVTPKFDLQTEIAANLLAEGLCRSVVLNSNSDWDTHISNAAQHGFYDALFSGLDGLAEHLTSRGIFEDTVVAVLSEMGRTPAFNRSNGKDHHGHTSALLFGGPVRGNAVSGATDDALMESQLVDLDTGVVRADGALLKYDSLAAGLMTGLGLDAGAWLPDAQPFLGYLER